MNAARVAVLLMLAANIPAVHAGYVPRAQVEAVARNAALQAKQLGDESELVGALRQARWRSAGEPLEGEARMLAALVRLRDVTAPNAMTRQAVTELLDYSPQTLTDPVDVEQRLRQVPAFQIAGAARAALTHWQLRADVAGLRKALAGADTTTIAATDNDAALSEVIRTATPAELEMLRSSANATPATLHALFLRLADPQLALDALRQPQDVEGLALIADVPRTLSAADALLVLGDSGIDADYRSAARLAIAPLIAQSPAARDLLLRTLGDEYGDASASALGRSGDTTAIAALAAIVDDDADTPRLRHALLGLRASADPTARAALQRFSDDGRRNAALREEVRSWLR